MASLVVFAVGGLACKEDPLGVLAIEFGLEVPEHLEMPVGASGEPVVEPVLLSGAVGAVFVEATSGMMTIELTGVPPLDDPGYHYVLWIMNHHGVEAHEPGGDHGHEGNGVPDGAGPRGYARVDSEEEEEGVYEMGHVEPDGAGRFSLMKHSQGVPMDLESVSGCMLTIVREGEEGPGEHIALFGKRGVPTPGGESQPGEEGDGGHGHG